jgi:hypothetical protein
MITYKIEWNYSGKMQTINALSLTLDYINYDDMMNFIVAFLSSKRGIIPQYRMTQLKNKFLEKCETKYGSYHCYTNGVVEGEY